MLAALAGGVIGGYIGGSMGSRHSHSVHVVHTEYRQKDIDYKKLAQEMLTALKKERIKAIQDRLSCLRQLEASNACKCAECGKEISCYRWADNESITSHDILFIFKCDCKEKQIPYRINKDRCWFPNEMDMCLERIIEKNRGTFWKDGYVVNQNKELFKYIFGKAYELWTTVTDKEKESGVNPEKEEIARLEVMLNDPLGLMQGIAQPVLMNKEVI